METEEIALADDSVFVQPDYELADASEFEDADYEMQDWTYREKVAMLLGNPHKDERGRFSTEDGTSSSGGQARYYIESKGGQHIVHDRLYSDRGDPYTRAFKSAKDAEEKRAFLEDKYGQQQAWVQVRDRAKTPPKSSDEPSERAQKIFDRVERAETPDFIDGKSWKAVDGAAVDGDVVGKVKSDDKMGGGMNVSRRLIIETKAGEVDGVFKPVIGERWGSVKRNGPIRFSVDRADGSQSLRESVAAAVDKALGTNLVPDTKQVKVGKYPGSITKFLDGTQTYATTGGAKTKADDWYKMAVFDLLIGNTDRHTKQVMVDKNGTLHALDHGLAFPRDDSEFKFRMADEVPKSASPALRKQLSTALAKTKWDRVIAPLGAPAQAAFYRRVEAIRKAVEADTVHDMLVRLSPPPAKRKKK